MGSRGKSLNFETSKLNNIDVRQKIIQAVKEGCNEDVAAARASISATTLSHWLLLGRRGDPGFAEFYAEVEQARKERPAESFTVKAGSGRRWTPETEQVIISLMRKGTTPRFAAEAAGVSMYALTENLKRGGALIEMEEAGGFLSESEVMLANFVLEFRRAVADAVNARVELLDRSQNPQWAAWWLERRFPEEWGNNAGIAGAERPTKVVLSWGDQTAGEAGADTDEGEQETALA